MIQKVIFETVFQWISEKGNHDLGFAL